MKPRAFTLLELILVIAIIGILAALLFPAVARAKLRAERVKCVNNLKETGIAFHLFANDHHGRLPMETPIREGGSLEWARTGNAFTHFAAMSSELVDPKLLVCPADTRLAAKDWSHFGNGTLSYFVSVESKLGVTQSLFSGDRNVSQTPLELTNVLQITYTNAQWTTNLHNAKGNLLFGDGSVLQANNDQLRDALRFSSK
jgi:prepilin-type N-terminal cleavage/methylation domain-containing protein/prepilin-type processing-associated H-X9-DG protein